MDRLGSLALETRKLKKMENLVHACGGVKLLTTIPTTDGTY